MSTNNSDLLNRAASDGEAWVAEVATNLGTEDRGRGYSALRAVLQSIRDFLPFDEALRLAHQLPVVLRGVYFDGLVPDRTRKESFLTLVAERLPRDLEPDDAVDAVFRVLQVRIPRVMEEAESRGWPGYPPPSKSQRLKRDATVREVEAAVDHAVEEGVPVEDLPTFSERPRKPEPRIQGPQGSVFSPALQKANLWLKDLMEHLGIADRGEGLAVFQAVMHSLRDRVQRGDALHLGAQLPVVLRGYYYEGWTADPHPSQERTLEDFKSDVLERLLGISSIDLDEAISGVFRLLSDRISAGEVSNVRGRLPEAIRELWPAEWVRVEPPPRAQHSERRSRVRKARKEIRTIIARGRAMGVRARELPVLGSRRRSNKRSPKPSK